MLESSFFRKIIDTFNIILYYLEMEVLYESHNKYSHSKYSYNKMYD